MNKGEAIVALKRYNKSCIEIFSPQTKKGLDFYDEPIQNLY
jgi:hypothetical protein